jgi:hypothetical protein
MYNRIEDWTAHVAGRSSSPTRPADIGSDENFPPPESCSTTQSCGNPDELLDDFEDDSTDCSSSPADIGSDENPLPSESCSTTQSCATDELPDDFENNSVGCVNSLLCHTSLIPSHYLGLGNTANPSLCARGRERDDCMGC